MKNQKGFGVVEVILMVVVVALVAFIGWRMWQANDDKAEPQGKKATQSQPPTDSQKPITDSTEQIPYLALKDYSVRIPLNDVTKGLVLGQVEDSTYAATDKSVIVLAPELDAGWTCEPSEDGAKGTIGSISITPNQQRGGPGIPLASKKVGAYTYGLEAGGSNCAGDAMAYQKLLDAFKAQFEQIATY